jgi:hypothetical protein
MMSSDPSRSDSPHPDQNATEKRQGDLFAEVPTTEDGEWIPKLRVLSFGAGQDSTALLEMWLGEEEFRKQYPAERLMVVFADTSDEHERTYRHLRRCQRRIAPREDVEMAWIRPEMGYHRESWPSLLGHYEQTNTIGSVRYPKTCSANLKISVIYKYLDDRIGELLGVESGRKRALYTYKERFGRLPVMIGMAAGEEDRRSGNDVGPKWMRRCIRKEYPLIEQGMDRADCQERIRRLGQPVPGPSLCRHCHFKDEKWLLRMKAEDPEGLKEWIELEQQKLEAWEDRCDEQGVDNATVWGDGRTLPEVLADAEKEYADWSLEEIKEATFSHGHCVGTTH